MLGGGGGRLFDEGFGPIASFSLSALWGNAHCFN